VGQYAKVKASDMKLTFHLRDCTGELLCFTTMDRSAAMLDFWQQLGEHDYIRIYGNSREDRSIAVTSAHFITDCNEITYHQIQAMHQHLKPTSPATLQQSAGNTKVASQEE
jgi:hypothetical protein